MKRIVLLLTVCLLTLSGIAQKKANYTEEDVKQFYRTMEGYYTGKLNDSVSFTLHFTPIWDHDPFRWLYMEVSSIETGAVVEQKIIEVRPISDIAFNVVVHDIAHPEQFAGKWSNRNFFDGFNTGILKGHGKFTFQKTKDFEYQTGWNRRKKLKCFPAGDRIHFKFTQENERFYVKRLLAQSSEFSSIVFFKVPID